MGAAVQKEITENSLTRFNGPEPEMKDKLMFTYQWYLELDPNTKRNLDQIISEHDEIYEAFAKLGVDYPSDRDLLAFPDNFFYYLSPEQAEGLSKVFAKYLPKEF